MTVCDRESKGYFKKPTVLVVGLITIPTYATRRSGGTGSGKTMVNQTLAMFMIS